MPGGPRRVQRGTGVGENPRLPAAWATGQRSASDMVQTRRMVYGLRKA